MLQLRIDGVCRACLSSSPSPVFAYSVHVSYSSSYLDMFNLSYPSMARQRMIATMFFGVLHPAELTWNLKVNPWKRRFLLETIIFRFHVSFRGGKINVDHSKSHLKYLQVDLKLGIITVDGSEIRRAPVDWLFIPFYPP